MPSTKSLEITCKKWKPRKSISILWFYRYHSLQTLTERDTGLLNSCCLKENPPSLKVKTFKNCILFHQLLKIKTRFHCFIVRQCMLFLVKLFVFPDSFNCLCYCFVSILLTVAAYFFGLILISYSWLIKSIQKIHILLEYFLLLSYFML